jgi:hypothetical protein
MEIKYKSNEELREKERLLKKQGFRKTSDCYWVQIYTDDVIEVSLVRE